MKRLIALLSLLNWVCSDDFSLVDFQVTPGGKEHTAFHKRDGATCTFKYVCQGGTNENWVLVITKGKDLNSYDCFVERKGGRSHSYIFFQKFHLSVDGNVQLQTGEAFKSEGVKLSTHEFRVDKNLKSISQVDGKFGSQLNRISIQYSINGGSDDL